MSGTITDNVGRSSGLIKAASSGGGGTSISDADANTKIQVEESSDENIIRFDVAGSEAMRINADGSVNMVLQPSFHAASDAQTNIGYNAYQTLTLGSEDHDVGSDLDLSNETFTCPVDGVYMFVLQINWLNTQTGYNYYHTALAVNSGYEHISFIQGSIIGAVQSYTQTGTKILSLSAGDTVKGNMRVDTTGSGSSTVDINSHSRFSGHLLA